MMVGYEYLSGYGDFEDGVRHIRIGSHLEYYVDDRKAIFRTAVPENAKGWQERVFTHPVAMRTMRQQIEMLRNAPGVEDLGEGRLEDDVIYICPACGGAGWYEDEEGNRKDCRICEGFGKF